MRIDLWIIVLHLDADAILHLIEFHNLYQFMHLN